MKNLLIFGLLFCSLIAQGQNGAVRVWRSANSIFVGNGPGTKITEYPYPSSDPRSTVTVAMLGEMIQVRTASLNEVYVPAGFLNQSGVAYHPTSASLAFAAYVASVPTSGTGTGGVTSYSALSDKPLIPSSAADVGAVSASTYTTNRTADLSAVASASALATTALTTANSATNTATTQAATIATHTGQIAALQNLHLTQVATRSFISTNTFPYTKQQSRTRHTAEDNITAIQFVFANWYIPATDRKEKTVGAASSITSTVEYNGVRYRITFAGSNTGTIGDGANLESDLVTLPVTIPKGASFYALAYIENASKIIGNDNISYDPAFDAFEFGAGITDKTGGGTIAQSAAIGYTPIAIRAYTKVPSAIIYGDSRSVGYGSTIQDNSGEKGSITPSLSPFMGYINTGISSQRLDNILSSCPRSIALSQYVTHPIISIAINDVNAGRTAAQILADFASLQAQFPATSKAMITTINPNPTNATTVASSNTVVTTINKTIRGGIKGFWSYFDLSDVVSTGRDSGLWKDGYSTDWIHETNVGNNAIKNSGVINPALFLY